MPNVLLFGGSKALYEMLRSYSGWNVVHARHADTTNSTSRKLLGDPTRWHLTIDDCAHGEKWHDKAVQVTVTNRYLAETGAPCAMFCDRGPGYHWGTTMRSPKGYRDLEFNQAPGTDDAASHLIDFVDEFEENFANARLGSDTHPAPHTTLFNNYYGEPLIVLRPEATLQMIDIPDDAVRLAAFDYLCGRTLPKLWPESLSHDIRPRRVVELEKERELVIARRRQEIESIDAALDAERRFYATYAPLTELADDALKNLVRIAFEKAFGFEVIDLDEEIEDGQPKTLDLLVRHSGLCAFVEVRASRNRGARVDDIERLDDHADAVTQRYEPPDFKLFVFNGMYRRGPESRTDDALFSNHVADEARGRGVTLISALRLLQAIEARRNDEITSEGFIDLLKSPGRFQPPWG